MEMERPAAVAAVAAAAPVNAEREAEALPERKVLQQWQAQGPDILALLGATPTEVAILNYVQDNASSLLLGEGIDDEEEYDIEEFKMQPNDEEQAKNQEDRRYQSYNQR